jgi:hypothetical protein|tara:strand:- start:4709 stop:5194 length:486 start_codon:yes stop_codon:yes gene_type:complete
MLKNILFLVGGLIVLGFAVFGFYTAFDLGLFSSKSIPQNVVAGDDDDDKYVDEKIAAAVAEAFSNQGRDDVPAVTPQQQDKVPSSAAAITPQDTSSGRLVVSRGDTGRYNEVVACLKRGGLVEGTDFRKRPGTDTGIQISSALRTASQEIKDLLARCQKPA